MSAKTILKGLLAAAVVAVLAAAYLTRHEHFVPEPPGNLGHLASIRGALSQYYSDSQGHYPPTLDALVPRYLDKIPEVQGLPGHQPSSLVVLVSSRAFTDSGGWLYVSDPAAPNFGEVRIDCTHARGAARWSDL